ncbi:DUF5994 family protein [Dactylosporangium sp. NPDC048998]|uniref:DUF5994 family protein n=1 Tax=Dactylosporangium sp. NPDC048998 TaxID=3363976 RepID=UPI00371620F4
MVTTTQRAIVVPPGPPSSPRLVLAPARADRAVLDGGWWPRSRDPVAELPGLVLTLAARYGPIRRLMLSSAGWDTHFHFRRLAVGADVIRAGWFATVDPGVLIATTDRGNQLDLLVVPPDMTDAAARSAMFTAADPVNRMRAPAILAALAAAPAADDGAGTDPVAVWDNEGGHGAATRAARTAADLTVA